MQKSFWKALGPGLIWAAAAIGVSHLVQSTRAGADYGFQLIGVVLLVNLFKYPFFQFGPRYAIATGENLIEGYRRMGKWVVVLFLLLTLGTMFTIQAAVTSVTVGIISSVFPSSLSYVQVTFILLLICALIIVLGHYKILDRLIKVVVVVLTLSTIAALVFAIGKNEAPVDFNLSSFEWNVTSVAFVIALAGWMPSAVDISVWNSLWTLAKIESTGYKPKLKEVLSDFNIGYIGTAIISLIFLGLGALVMYNSGQTFADGGVDFANQLFTLYTNSIGQWSYSVIAIAAIATMFSTTLTVLDAYPRVLNPIFATLVPRYNKPVILKRLTFLWIFLLIIVSLLIIDRFSERMKLLVDIATTLSFVTAPILGYLNLRAITGKNVDPKFQPGLAMRILTWTGLVVLSGFTIYYLLMLVGIV